MGNFFSASESGTTTSQSEEESPRSKFGTPSVSSRSTNVQNSSNKSSQSTSTESKGGMRKIETVPNPSKGFRGASNGTVLK